ncbi:hypothetical protein EJ04DRAFT_552885 [Polyplosphaeria fusca]|uniref:Uncharacterized protein n=1 Tax=Polyplosphaeria fusca TaxID=682080 RepID=A0A9P4QZ07_9PLEO|nr:hypothetical protein EJ04DRAFT_552885 [Polyplosphaeria fusca]
MPNYRFNIFALISLASATAIAFSFHIPSTKHAYCTFQASQTRMCSLDPLSPSTHWTYISIPSIQNSAGATVVNVLSRRPANQHNSLIRLDHPWEIAIPKKVKGLTVQDGRAEPWERTSPLLVTSDEESSDAVVGFEFRGVTWNTRRGMEDANGEQRAWCEVDEWDKPPFECGHGHIMTRNRYMKCSFPC